MGQRLGVKTVNFWPLRDPERPAAVSLPGPPGQGFWDTRYVPGCNFEHLKRGPKGSGDQRLAQISFLRAGHQARKLPTVHSPIIQMKHKTQAPGSHTRSPRTPQPEAEPGALGREAGIRPFPDTQQHPTRQPPRTLWPVPLGDRAPRPCLGARSAVATVCHFPGS